MQMGICVFLSSSKGKPTKNHRYFVGNRIITKLWWEIQAEKCVDSHDRNGEKKSLQCEIARCRVRRVGAKSSGKKITLQSFRTASITVVLIIECVCCRQVKKKTFLSYICILPIVWRPYTIHTTHIQRHIKKKITLRCFTSFNLLFHSSVQTIFFCLLGRRFFVQRKKKSFKYSIHSLWLDACTYLNDYNVTNEWSKNPALYMIGME